MNEGQPVSVGTQPLWTAREGVEKVFELQGQPVNLLMALQEIPYSVNHVHYGEFWYKGAESVRLRRKALSYFNEFPEGDVRGSVTNLYTDYFYRLGLPGNYFLGPTTDLINGTKFPIGLTGSPRLDESRIAKAIKTFPMIDFRADIEMKREPLKREGKVSGLVTHSIPINLNTTRIEGNIYEVFTPNGEGEGFRDSNRLISALNLIIGLTWPEIREGVDAFVMPFRAQRVISALLTARV